MINQLKINQENFKERYINLLELIYFATLIFFKFKKIF